MSTDERLDRIFTALADPTRRAMLQRLTRGDATVTELGEPFDMTQPAITRHLKVLERAGLVSRRREGQTRPAHLEAEPLREVVDWMGDYMRFWSASFDRLDDHLERMKADRRRTIAESEE